MTCWHALRRLLPLLAVLSLALTPVAAPAATAGMHASTAHGHPPAATGDYGLGRTDHAAMGDHAGVDMASMDDMPCCPKAAPAKPDCAKDCPLMALCLASMASLPPTAFRVPVPVARRARMTWPVPAPLSSVPGHPLPEPPRA